MVWAIGFDPRPPGSLKEAAGLTFFPSLGVTQQKRRIGGTEICMLAVRREPGSKEKIVRRRIDKALDWAKKHGVRRLALPDELLLQAKEMGLSQVDMRDVYWSLAFPIALAAITQKGLDPMRTSVVLVSSRACEEMRQVAWKLAFRVRYVTTEGGAFAKAVKQELMLEFGMPPQAASEDQNSIALVFSGDAPAFSVQTAVDLTGGMKSGMLVPIIHLKDLMWPPYSFDKPQASGALWLSGTIKESELEISFR